MSVNPYAPPAMESPLVAELVVDETGWSLDFDVVLEDLVGWNLYCHRHLPVLRRSLSRGMWMIGGMIVISIGLLVLLDPRPTLTNLVFIAALLGVLGLFPLLYRWRLRRLSQGIYREGASHSVGRRRLSLLRDYVVYSTPMSQSITRWAGIERVICEKEAIYILLSNITAIPVPRRAFANDEQFRNFAKTAEDCHLAAKPLPIA